MSRRAAAAALVLLIGLTASCSDGRPGFCDALETNADLEPLAEAIADSDGERAAAEAQRLIDLSEDAPPEVRGDLRELANAIEDIVAHAADLTDPASDPAEVERRRDQINERLGTLDRRIERVSTWAERECGLRLN